MDADALLARLATNIRDTRVLAAVARVPRDVFVPAEHRARAWEDGPLPIGCGQTISQPFVVARMCELLGLDGRGTVLDVGTGSGYHAAVLAQLCDRVVSVERHPELAEAAVRRLAVAGIANVEVLVGDGTHGVPSRAPFAGINAAAAAAAEVPPALVAQLAPAAALVMPVECDGGQRLVRVRNGAVELHERVRFVPLITG